MTKKRKSASRDEISFRPKFRRDTAREKKRADKFLNRFLKGLRKRRKEGSSRGRNYSHGKGRVYANRHQLTQRVVVKARVVRNGGGSLKEHFHYIERRRAGREEERGRVFGEHGYLSDKEREDWLTRTENDRHHFRLIVSPENTSELDLEEFARDFGRGLERDLGTKLEWVGVVHRNTDNAHVHFIIRGVTGTGEDLVITRHYISNGMRSLAANILTDELGYRLESEVERERKRCVTESRFTWLDRKLLETGEVFDLRGDTRGKLLLIGRVQFLKTLGLASQIEVGCWRLDPDLEVKLRELGKRGDIVKRLHELSGLRAEPAHLNEGESASGKVLAVGVHDELSGKPQLVIECDDGKLRSVLLSEGRGQGIRKGDFVILTRSEKPERGAFRGQLLGRTQALVNVRMGESEERWRQSIRSAIEVEREQEEDKARRRTLRLEQLEKERLKFRRRARDVGRER